jgi:hypothetical protein
MNITRTTDSYLETDPAPRPRSNTPDLDALALLMDNAFGDIVSMLVSLYVLGAAQRYGLSRITTARMGLNIAIDAIIGAIPIVGDAFDLVWKANQRNVALVQRHMNTPLHLRNQARRGDWLYVAAIAAVLVVVLAGLVYGAYLAIAAIIGWLA